MIFNSFDGYKYIQNIHLYKSPIKNNLIGIHGSFISSLF